jgi:hypothetical protein
VARHTVVAPIRIAGGDGTTALKGMTAAAADILA